MTNQLNITVNLSATVAGQLFPVSVSNNIVPAADIALKETLSIATSATAIPLTGFTQAAYVVIVNLDPTNYVEVSYESTAAVTPNRIQPGGVIVLCPESGAVLYGKANTAAVNIAYTAVSI